jgi:hypothetical protein
MRRLIVFVALLGVIGGGAYLYFFKKKEVQDLLTPPARTALESVDKFRDAVKDRNYKRAARYCTQYYGELLTKSHDAAKKVGDIVDDLKHRLTNDGLMTDELRNILNALDPLPTDMTMLVVSPGDRDAVVTIAHVAPYPADWQIGNLPIMALYVGMPTTIKAIKEGDGDKAEWKLDFPAPAVLQQSVLNLTTRYMDVYNALNTLTYEVKNQPTTKENVKERMKTLLETAAHNPR